MMKSTIAAALVAAFTASGATGATFDQIFVESNGKRADANGDVPTNNAAPIGAFGAGEHIGIGGRIVTAEDAFTFSTSNAFTIKLTNLGIDSNFGFDSGDLFGNNGVTTARFSLLDSSDVEIDFAELTSTDPGLLSGLHLAGGAGDDTLLIDGLSGGGSTYDLKLSTAPAPIPVQAALPLLLSGVGALAAFRRRARA